MATRILHVEAPRLSKHLFQSRNIGQRTWASGIQSTTPENPDVEFHIIPVSRYDISDDRSLETEFYPRVLTDKWAREVASPTCQCSRRYRLRILMVTHP